MCPAQVSWQKVSLLEVRKGRKSSITEGALEPFALVGKGLGEGDQAMSLCSLSCTLDITE